MFTEKELKELLDDLYMDDTVDMLEELPANLVKRILATVSASDRSMINQLLNYPEDSAGSIMTTEYVDLREEMLSLIHILPGSSGSPHSAVRGSVHQKERTASSEMFLSKMSLSLPR